MTGQRPGRESHGGGVLAVDLGGTQLRVAAADADGRLLARSARSTPAGGPDAVVAAVAAMAADLAPPAGTAVLPPAHPSSGPSHWPSPRAVGVAAPGPLDPVSGAIIATPNLEGFEGYPLRERLVAALGLPVLVQNDATLAALGEHLHGAGRGSHLMLYLTVSTGVGGGVVRNGTLETGVHGLGAEFGHIVVADGGRACSFGHRGCLEGLASGTAIALAAREAIASGASTSLGPPAEHPTAREVARAAEHGDELALAIMASAGHYLGVAVGSLVNAFDPDLVVVGGGVAASWPLLAEAVRRAATEVVMCRDLDVEGTSVPGAVLAELTQEGSGLRSGDTGPGAATASGPLVRVTRALTGDDAGLLGAAAWALAQS